MAAYSSEEAKSHFSGAGLVDGNGNLPSSYSSFNLAKPSFKKIDNDCSLDVFPVRYDEAPFPVEDNYALNSSLGQDVCSISVLPDEGHTSPSQLTFFGYLKVPFSSKDKMSVDAKWNCQKCLNLQMKGAEDYGSCIVDIGVDNGNSEAVKVNDEAAGNMKTEGVHTQKVLQRQASLNVDKPITERVHDAPINRWRRYKRAASFDSRKIVFLFSILSSLGTFVLICLTLRVKQAS